MGEDEGIGMPGIGVMAHGVDQMLADRRSTKSYHRELHMMDKQNAMNLSNAKSMPMIQAEGLRMAGFNPAMVAGAGSSPAPTVSKGSADMAQTIPFDAASIAQLGLIEAQKDNIEAQTQKLKAETASTKWDQSPNVRSSTAANTASALKNGADAVRIQNENEAFEDENTRLGEFGPAMAQKWQSQPWYKALGSDTKATIDGMADGSIPLTVGGMRAISKVIASQKDMSDADRAMVDNAFANAITEAMWKDPKVKEALARMPVTQQNEAQARTAKYLVETGILRIDKANKQDQRDVYLHQDPDKLYMEYQKDPSLENFVKWMSATANDKLNKAYDAGVHAVGPAAGGYLAGKGMQKATEISKQGSGHTKTIKYPDKVDPPIYDASGKRVKGTGGTSSWTEYRSEDEGVQQMFNKRK